MSKKTKVNFDFDPLEKRKNKKPKTESKYDPSRKNKKYYLNEYKGNSNEYSKNYI